GRTGSRERAFTYNDVDFPLTEERNDFLPRLWATRRVGWLMEQIRTNGEQKELTDEIVDLGTRYGIVTPYTSYLAVEPERAADFSAGDGRARPKSRPVTNGNRAGGAGGLDAVRDMPAPAEAAKTTTGEVAVRQSKRARAQQEAIREDDEVLRVETGARKAGDKTFYQREGVWVDSEFKPEAKLPETALAFGSDEYFDLLEREPQL